MIFTKNDTLASGGIDSNVKVWRSVLESVMTPSFVFLKHTDKVICIKSFVKGDDEYLLTGDDGGAVYYWKIGGYKAERYIPVDGDSLMDGNDSLIFTLAVEQNNVCLKKFSFVQRTLISKVYLQHYEGKTEIEVKSLLGYNDSEFFHAKRKLFSCSPLLHADRQGIYRHLETQRVRRILPR